MNARSLTPADFPQFMKGLWGYDPFPWQTRLLARVAAAGWPDTLDLPTAAGKTAVLDIAVFALALDAVRDASERRAPLRVVFVIDRRVVVDQAFERADAIAAGLMTSKDRVVSDVAHNLRSLQKSAVAQPGRAEQIRSSDSEPPPLMAAVLRGGMPRESDWARTPSQPLILVSTVDQVGSRLLFRGYGVSDSMRPIHAGLLGEDVLYLLDEVHLSRPFEQTLMAIKDRYVRTESAIAVGVPSRFDVVRMSATPASTAREVFTLDERDHEHPTLSRRIRASKQALLRAVPTPKDENKARAKLADACVAEARKLFASGGVGVVGIIVNRVDTARRVAWLAEQQDASGNEWTVRLMTGRMRPLDRQDLLLELQPRIMAGRDRSTLDRLLVVSTQAIEAGADFDFDALVTECASLDALRQRFGRLDRVGDLETTHAVILAGTGQTSRDGEVVPADAVYGEALARTWTWLTDNAEPGDSGPYVDFGVAAMEDHLRSIDEALLAPRVTAPLLLPVHVDLYAQTAPRPAVEPDVAFFLHGPERRSVDVQVVWRADLEETLLSAVSKGDAPQHEARILSLRQLASACPPSALEAMAVPLHAARAWLAAVAARRVPPLGGAAELVRQPSVADVEGAAPDKEGATKQIAPALVWRSDESQVILLPGMVRPGDTIVVPATYGGVRHGNWDPEDTSAVNDRGDEGQLLHRAQAVIRWHPNVIAGWSPISSTPMVDEKDVEDGGIELEREAFAAWAKQVLAAGPPDWARLTLEAIVEGRNRIVRVAAPDSDYATTPLRMSIAARRVPRRLVRELRLRGLESMSHDVLLDSISDDDAGTFGGQEIRLIPHLRAVGDFVRQFAACLGLGKALLADLVLAGSVHDVGKADPRFQQMLHGGDPVRHAMAGSLLAKSGIPTSDRAGRERARRASGYPVGTRHEMLSVALVEHSSELQRQASDWHLVLHLIASHHGHCRPFAPVMSDASPEDVEVALDGAVLRASTAHTLARLDSGVSDRFWNLVRHYGWWRLAWLEAILRLADHRASEQQEEREHD